MGVEATARAKQGQGTKSRPKTRPPGRLLPKTVRPFRASPSYLALARAYPIHPIYSEEDLDQAIAVLDHLQARTDPLDFQEQGYLESLAHEIERYEAEAHPMPTVSGAD